MTGAAALAGVLVAASVALVGWRGRGVRAVRGVRGVGPQAAGPWDLGPLGVRLGASGEPRAGSPERGARRPVGLTVDRGTAVLGTVAPARRGDVGVPGECRLAAALVDVSSMLRAGAAPADAWTHVLGSPVPDRVPTVDQLMGIAGDRRAGRRDRGSAGLPLAAVVAAARVADELGAPLATVLDQVSAAVGAQAEEVADVGAALAGPRSSARVLAWLPVLGVLLGTALGADPVGVLLGGGPGTVAGVLGLVLVLVGRRWSRVLLRRAERAGGAV